ncbi:aquaporin family protein [Gammaproteobacteria bacterium]|nr:aquaporin family protein [Gammaproteobacteria bacterium]MDC0392253.1 aquaporin family protein [Gammaproteobacteria bacterium]MDC1100390.1 aquaporin family protein [Gammaproteobacteria bacterium]
MLTKKLIAEFVGTCFLVMIVVGSGIMAQNLSSDLIIILLANTIATGAGLTALIWIFITISGAHFNPAVSLIMYLNNELELNECIYFISVQFVGGFCGVLLANIMYGLDPIQIAENQRGGLNIYFSEFIATFGLIMTIIGVKNFNTFAIAPAVGLYITAGYWFTSSTSFANPAVTLSRAFTDTFTGINYEFILPFIIFQLFGALSAMFMMKLIQRDN